MINIDWKFKEARNVMVITTKSIISGRTEITYVSHDEDDGMWQFLDDNWNSEEDASIVSLQEIIILDNSLIELADLPLGWIAWRKKGKGSKWNRQKNI